MTGSLLVLPASPLAEEIRAFASEHRLADRWAELDAKPEFPWPEFRAMGEAKLLGLRTPAGLGGRGLKLVDAGSALFHLAYRAGTTFAKLSLQPEFSSVLAEHGARDVVDEFFRPLMEGRVLVGNQVTEPGAGADVRRIEMTAAPSGGEYLLRGTKSEAAFSCDAQVALVYARITTAEGRADGLTAFLVPQDLSGIHRRVIPDLGERWMRRGTVEYEDVHLPGRYRIGSEGEALDYVKAELTRERALLGAIYLGVAWASWSETVAYVGDRLAFGRPLAANQGVAFPLVQDGARLSAAWQFVCGVLQQLDRHDPATGEAALAKWLATDTALLAIDHAIQFHGGRGYSKALPHEQRWRDVRSGGIAHGPSEILLEIAARGLWPRPGRRSS